MITTENQPVNETDERGGLASASKMDRYKHCHGSFNAEQRYSQEEESEFLVRDQGDEVHEVLETDSIDKLDDGEIKRIAAGVKKLEKKAIEDFAMNLGLTRKEFDSEVQVIREERFWILDKDGNQIFSAKPDLVMIHADSALVVDYKTGYLPVTPAIRNMQIRTQCLAVWKNHPTLRHIRGAVAAYRLTGSLVQVDYELGDLFAAMRELTHILWRTRDPDAERVPGDWCRYCPAKANCPQAAAYALLPVVYIGDNVKVKDVPNRSLDLNLQQLAAIHKRKSIAGHIFKAVHNRLRNMTDAELATVLLKKVKGRDIHNYSEHMLELYSRLVNEEWCSGEEFIASCSPSKEKLAAMIAPRIQESSVAIPISREQAEAKLEKTMLEYAVTVQAAPSVKGMSKEDIKLLNKNKPNGKK